MCTRSRLSYSLGPFETRGNSLLNANVLPALESLVLLSLRSHDLSESRARSHLEVLILIKENGLMHTGVSFEEKRTEKGEGRER